MAKFLGSLASIALIIFAILKWGGIILAVFGIIVAVIVQFFFVGGGDE